MTGAETVPGFATSNRRSESRIPFGLTQDIRLAGVAETPMARLLEAAEPLAMITQTVWRNYFATAAVVGAL